MRHCLIFIALLILPATLFAGENNSAFVPLLSQEEAWKCLPRPEKEIKALLPNWALALAKTLPRTTAAMLELDYLSRAKNPLDAKLRGKIRWVAARANRCEY